MISEANALPPGESTRKTTALTPCASRASRKARAMVSEPITSSLPKRPKPLPLGPRMMAPTPLTTAILAPPRDPCERLR